MTSHARVSVSTTSTLLSKADPSDAVKGEAVAVQNPSTTATVYLGGAGVTAVDYGYELAPGGEVAIDLEPAEPLYAVVASGSVTVNVLYQGA